MASWDDSKQVHIALRGGNIEASEATLVAGTVEVPTRLQNILAAWCTWKDDPARADNLTCDCAITAGCVTVACQSPWGNEKVSVLLVGLA